MSVLLIVLAVLCVLVGIAGCILPVLPGPPLSFVALLLMRWSGAAEFDSRFLTIWGLATLAVTVLDYLLPAWLARRFGGSKQAARGSLVGLIVGMVFFPPAGLIVSDKLRALRVAVSSFAAFILGTGMKLAVSLAIGFYVIRALFV